MSCAKFTQPRVERHVFTVDPDASPEQMKLRAVWLSNLPLKYKVKSVQATDAVRRCGAVAISLRCVVTLLALASLCGCTRTVYVPADGAVADDRYDTPLSQRGGDDAFERAFAAIHFVNSVAYYRRVVFAPGDVVDARGLTADEIKELAVSSDMYHETASGTATAVLKTLSRIAFVTSAHVVAFEDTVLTYYVAEGEQRSVHSLSVKLRHSTYIPDIPGADRIEILAIDEDRDVALLGQTISDLRPGSVRVIDFPIGTVSDLQWGSEVFVFGFPAGARMMTSGLVSKTFRDQRSAFLTDAAFNRGFSGGLVLAVRDGLPNFEWVGIASSAAASTEFILSPPADALINPEDLGRPYDGPIILTQKKRLRYGITTCTSVDVVLDVLRENAPALAARGYVIDIGR
ncbi:MAG: trypsin-like peptidase domain-containing protein [Rhodothermales bacterium]|nr:trypsin-like peptidase domain-containing protein [Rhodothermales bacterium]